MARTTTTKRTTKTDQVVALLKRKQGATLDDLVKATGWLPHTTRAALTGLRKKEHAIRRVSVDSVNQYSIAAGA